MAWEVEALLATFFTVSIYSIIFKDTPLFRFGERTFVGLSLGVTVTMSVITIMNKVITPLTQGNLSVLLPMILGIMMLFRFSSKYKWLNTYPIVIMAGVGLALKTRTALGTYIIAQIKTTLNTQLITNDIYTTAGNIFGLIAIISGLCYFIFATEDLPDSAKKTVGSLAKIGRLTIMMYLGSSFANVLLGRQSMLLERILSILKTFGLVA